jgi:quercetin dioxygenase-like cupin family protein
MLKRTALLSAVAVAAIAGSALATPPIGNVVAETTRGSLAGPLNVRTKFAPGTGVMLKTSGDIEVISQRIVAEPGSSFGWHSHPGESVAVVMQGAITLFEDENCTVGSEYGPGDAFPTPSDEVHLAHSSGTEPLILFATYFAHDVDPPLQVRVDEPMPAEGCPE